MAKLKPSDMEMKTRLVQATISNKMILYGLSEEHVAIKIHLSKRTLHNKIGRPETFKLLELWKLAEILKLSPEEKAQIL